MIIRLDVDDMERQFKAFDRDYFSYEGYDTLLDMYDDMDPDMELDVIAICEEWAEYGPNASLDLDDFISDYGYQLNLEDWVRDNIEGMEDADDTVIQALIDNGDIGLEAYTDALAEELSYDTTVVTLANGDYLVQSF